MWQSIIAIIALVLAFNSPLAGAQMAPVVVVEPPPIQFAAPPDMVVVPSGDSYVYMVPGQVGFYFYGGYWYRYWEDRWYRANGYAGPWGYVDVGIVPPLVLGIAPEYPLFLPRGYHRIHYGDFYGHWRAWDHDRPWHHQEWFRHEMRSDIVRDRHLRAERERVHIHEGERARFHGGGMTHSNITHGGTTTRTTTTHTTTTHGTLHGTTAHGTTAHGTTAHGTTAHGTTAHGTTVHSTTVHSTTSHSGTGKSTTSHNSGEHKH